MLQSLIPGASRVSLWVVFCCGLWCGPSFTAALAQTPKAAEIDADTPSDDKEDDAEKRGLVDTKKAGQAGLEERFQDPNAAEALENTFPELFPRAVQGAAANDRLEKSINAMAQGGNVDRTQVVNYLQAQAAIMTKHTNIAAILDPELPSKAVKDMEAAAYRIRHPLEIAVERRNANFRKLYVEALLSMADDLLKNHLFARVWTMDALSRSMDDAVIPTFVKQLDDDKQVLSVKLLAAVGLRNLTEDGSRDLSLQTASKAARSLADFLDRNRRNGPFWPVQSRALEALGALRISTSSATQPKAEFAETALSFLADPTAAPATRSAAGWALGMMRPVNPQFNFALVAYHDGLAVADIADEIVKARDTNAQRAMRLTELLIPLYQCFVGVGPKARNSGLLNAANPNLNPQKSKLTAIEALVRDVVEKAIELSQSVGSQVKEKQAALSTSISALRDGLKTPPADLALIPGGDPFPPPTNPAEPTAPTTSTRPAAEALAAPARGLDTSSLNNRRER